MRNIANFFWFGPCLGLQERVCLESFVRHGFTVRLFAYDNSIEAPDGVTVRDASVVLPKSDLRRYTQAGMVANLAAFSDAFRYNLMKKVGGWWFDADVLCLDDCGRFIDLLKKKEKIVSLGYQSADVINGAVLYAEDETFLDSLLTELGLAGESFGWGWIGPHLLTRVVAKLGYEKFVEKAHVFYPIHYNDFSRIYDPKFAEWCFEQTEKSLAVHLWHEFSRKNSFPKNMLPPVGSFLHAKFLEVSPSMSSCPAVSWSTLERLFYNFERESEYKRLKKFEENIMSHPVLGRIIRFRRHLKNL